MSLDEELLSAYLDGELSADERLRVEHSLAESPASRQLLDELRSIRTSLQRIPRARLGHDFADQVLREAEKEVLSVTAGADGDALESDRERPNVVSPIARVEMAEEPGRISWRRLRRPVIWASLTLAAGLLIMFVDRDRRPNPGREVAMAGREGKEIEVQWRDGTTRDGTTRDGTTRDGTTREGAEIGAPAEPALHDSLEPSSAAQPRPENLARRYGRSESTPAGAAPPPAGAPTKAPYNPPPPSAAVGGRAMAPAVGKPAQTDSDEKASRPLMEEKLDSNAGLAGVELKLLAAENNTLLVWCDVAPGTNYSESFREMLAGQNIRWEAEAEVTQKETPLGLKAKGAEESPAGKPPAESERDVQLDRRGRQKRLAEAEQAVLDTNNEVVLVEAAQPQIEAVLAAIGDAASVFVNVDVEAPPEAPGKERQLEWFARKQVGTEKLGDLAQKATKESKKREEPLNERGGKSAAGQADQGQSAAGTARRLTVRAAQASDETPEDEVRKDEPESLSTRANEGRDVKAQKAAEPPVAFGLGMPSRQAADNGRFQVLFVLHPVESAGTAGDAKPSDDKD
jgi:hypothetical protein